MTKAKKPRPQAKKLAVPAYPSGGNQAIVNPPLPRKTAKKGKR